MHKVSASAKKMGINPRSCRLLAAIETDEAAQSWAHQLLELYGGSLPLPELRDGDGRLKRLEFVSAIWVPRSPNHRDQFVLSQGDQRERPHINTDESCTWLRVPPCFKLPVSLLLIPIPAPRWV